MNREEVRDQLLAPVLQWTRLGRQFNQGMLASMEVITQRSYGLLRGHTSGDGHDWEEMALMTRDPHRRRSRTADSPGQGQRRTPRLTLFRWVVRLATRCPAAPLSPRNCGTV